MPERAFYRPPLKSIREKCPSLFSLLSAEELNLATVFEDDYASRTRRCSGRPASCASFCGCGRRPPTPPVGPGPGRGRHASRPTCRVEQSLGVRDAVDELLPLVVDRVDTALATAAAHPPFLLLLLLLVPPFRSARREAWPEYGLSPRELELVECLVLRQWSRTCRDLFEPGWGGAGTDAAGACCRTPPRTKCSDWWA